MMKLFTCLFKKQLSTKHFPGLSPTLNYFTPNKPIVKHMKRFFSTNPEPPASGCGKGSCGCKSNPPILNENPKWKEDKETEEFKKMNYKIINCINLGQFQEALDLSEDFIEGLENVYGKEHPFYCSALNNKAFILKTCGEYAEAKDLFEECCRIYKQLYTEKNEKYIITMQNLATLLRETKDYHKSLEIYEDLKKIVDSDPSLVKPNVKANILMTAGGNYRALKNFEESMRLLKEALKLTKDNYGDRVMPCATIYNNMGMTLKDQGEYDQAFRYFSLALEIREEFLEKAHPDVVAIRHNIAQLFMQMGDKDQAMKYYNENLSHLEKKEKEQQDEENAEKENKKA